MCNSAMNSTYLCLLPDRLPQYQPKNRSQMVVMKNLLNPMKKTVSDAVEYASRASIYSPEETVSELTTAQTSVLTLFYGLLFGDLRLCESIIQVEVSQLKSTFLRVWLADDFSFCPHDVAMVLSMLSFLLDSQRIHIPNHILRIFGGLVQKYELGDCCSQDLLGVFNDGQVVKEEQAMGMEKNSSTQSRKNDLTNTHKLTNGLNTAFQRMGSMKLKWFKKSRHAETKTVDDEEFVIVNKEHCENLETNCSPDSILSEKNDKPLLSSENLSEDSVVQSDRKYVSGNIPKELPKERKINKYTVVDSEGRTLLHRLAQFGRTEAVRRLLDEGVHPNLTDYSGMTALHFATQYDHWTTVELLLKAGSNVNARTNLGKTPLCLVHFSKGAVSKSWEIIAEYGGTM
ncbi:uncharacterized protein [Halyomorpha halys]|uniref:uncharacterized protein n=1 Tax=Halyomorpha halys TaxID=286706 RepID=UPI0006D523C2|nr:ankyrin repeat domain-containing protein 1-like [Halyomorpha halys]